MYIFWFFHAHAGHRGMCFFLPNPSVSGGKLAQKMVKNQKSLKMF
jgi:hypothetical protein